MSGQDTVAMTSVCAVDNNRSQLTEQLNSDRRQETSRLTRPTKSPTPGFGNGANLR